MEIRYLQSYLQVAKDGNFTKAADRLGYSQGTVTVQIKQLEKEIGAPLFQRIGNKSILTSAGEKLIEYANQMLLINDNIKNLASTNPILIKGILRIGFIDSLSTYLIPVIDTFHKHYPNVVISATSGYTKDLFESLYKNDTDIVIAINRNDVFSFGVQITKKEEILSIFSSTAHPLAKKTEVSLADICRYPLILSGPNSYLESKIYTLADCSGIEIKSFIHTNSNNLTIGLVEKELCIGILSNEFLNFYNKNNTIKILNTPDINLGYTICAYRNRNTWLSPQAEGFIKLLKQHI